MEAVVMDGQSLPDIAVQEYGDLRAVVALAQANNISITDVLTVGQKLVSPERVYNRETQDYCHSYGVAPATARTGGESIRLRIFTEQFIEQFM